MHKSVRQAAAAAPDKLSCITGEKSQHSSLCHLTIQRSIKRSARSRPNWRLRLPSVDVAIINLIRNLSIVHLSLCCWLWVKHTPPNIQAESDFHVAYSLRSWPAAGGAPVKSVTLKIGIKWSDFLCVCRDAYKRGHLHTWRLRRLAERESRQIQGRTPPALQQAQWILRNGVGWASRTSSRLLGIKHWRKKTVWLCLSTREARCRVTRFWSSVVFTRFTISLTHSSSLGAT